MWLAEINALETDEGWWGVEVRPLLHSFSYAEDAERSGQDTGQVRKNCPDLIKKPFLRNLSSSICECGRCSQRVCYHSWSASEIIKAQTIHVYCSVAKQISNKTVCLCSCSRWFFFSMHHKRLIPEQAPERVPKGAENVNTVGSCYCRDYIQVLGESLCNTRTAAGEWLWELHSITTLKCYEGGSTHSSLSQKTDNSLLCQKKETWIDGGAAARERTFHYYSSSPAVLKELYHLLKLYIHTHTSAQVNKLNRIICL